MSWPVDYKRSYNEFSNLIGWFNKNLNDEVDGKNIGVANRLLVFALIMYI